MYGCFVHTSEEGIGFHGTTVRDVMSVHVGTKNLTPNLWKSNLVLLTSEPSLYTPVTMHTPAPVVWMSEVDTGNSPDPLPVNLH